MSGEFRVRKAAGRRIDEIYCYTLETWGETQARAYIDGMFARFQSIADGEVFWRPIPAQFGVSGYFTRYEKHFIFWRELPGGVIGIAAVLHQRMDLAEQLRNDMGGI